MKLKIIIFILIVHCFCLIHAPSKNFKIVAKTDHFTFKKYFYKIAYIESDNNHYDENNKIIISHKGAIGRYQLMPHIAHELNKVYGTKFKISHISNEFFNELMAEMWYSNLYYLIFNKDVFKSVNAYNMGRNSHRINRHYTSNISPHYYNAHLRYNRITYVYENNHIIRTKRR